MILVPGSLVPSPPPPPPPQPLLIATISFNNSWREWSWYSGPWKTKQSKIICFDRRLPSFGPHRLPREVSLKMPTILQQQEKTNTRAKRCWPQRQGDVDRKGKAMLTARARRSIKNTTAWGRNLPSVPKRIQSPKTEAQPMWKWLFVLIWTNIKRITDWRIYFSLERQVVRWISLHVSRRLCRP